jgi:hypothetical protein
MKLYEFIEKYMPDFDLNQERGEDDGFPYDAVVEDIDGRKVKIVYAGTEEIPISEILENDLEQFRVFRSSPEALDVYEKYMSCVVTLEGPELMRKLAMAAEADVSKVKESVEAWRKWCM